MSKYINDERFSDEVIAKILARCGFEVTDVINNSAVDGDRVVEAITRGEKMHMVRCKNLEKDDMMNAIYQRFPMLGMFGRYGMGQDIELVIIEDFYISRFKTTDEIEEVDKTLFKEFYQEMCDIFGDEYKKDFEEYYENQDEQTSECENDDEKQA